LLEEIGLSARRWTDLGEMYTSNCFTNERGYIFVAEDLSQGVAQPDPTEKLEIKSYRFWKSGKWLSIRESKTL
jgi:ADP-ribose pyrophosphatase